MNIKLLEKLCLTAGVPGREYRITELIKKEIKGLFDEVSVDPLGSIIAVKKPSGVSKVGKKSTKKKTRASKAPKKVMLAAHMDQIGFLVTHIDDKGFIHVNPVGGFDTRNLFARAVTICPDLKDPKKDFTGIMNPSGRPVHIAPPEERKKIPEVRDFIIDTGMDKKQVEKKVKLGNMVVIQAPCYQLGDYMVSQAMDNRIACWVAIEAMKKLKTHDCEIHCVFTVQEEVGLRGAVASTHTIEPDIGIGIDITLACDTPGVPPIDNVTKLGEGASIVVMDSSVISDHGLVETFDALAKKHKIKAQRAIMARGGTDTGGIQRTAGGCKAMTLGVPGRYVHTVTEMCHKGDLEACRDLLAKYLESVK
ncbi:MAG: M20/M25/M40 family metallo-hydrolase [Planctomycetota bacterium]